MVESRGAKISADTLRDQGQQIGSCPAQRPCDQRRTCQPPQISRHQPGVDVFAVLERNQHIVHQWHGQVGRHQRRGSRQQGQNETKYQLPLIGPCEAPQAQQHPGRRGRVQFACTDRADLGFRWQWCLAGGAQRDLIALVHGLSGQMSLLALELFKPALRPHIDGQRKPPKGQPAFGVEQFKAADPAMVRLFQAQDRLQQPFKPDLGIAIPGQDASIRQDQQVATETHFRIQVNLKRRQNVFIFKQARLAFSQLGMLRGFDEMMIVHYVFQPGGRDRLLARFEVRFSLKTVHCPVNSSICPQNSQRKYCDCASSARTL